jgi:hypothetical protein
LAIILRHGGETHISTTIPARKTVEFKPLPDIGFGFVKYEVHIVYDPKGDIDLEKKAFLLGCFYI